MVVFSVDLTVRVIGSGIKCLLALPLPLLVIAAIIRHLLFCQLFKGVARAQSSKIFDFPLFLISVPSICLSSTAEDQHK